MTGTEERDAPRRLIVAANRGPVSFNDDPSGKPIVTRGAGGLVTVLTAMLRKRPGLWVATAQSDEETRLAARGEAVEVTLEGDTYRVRYVAPDPETYFRYYNIVANPILWFIQHYLWDLGWHPDIRENELLAWREGYVPVNRMVAEAMLDEIAGAGERHIGVVHDYHLYLASSTVRRSAPGVFLQQFVHIPWAQSDYWRILPREIREAIFDGLLANDIVAFHTNHYVDNFLSCCAELLDLEVDLRRRAVLLRDREVWVRAYPVSIDPETLEAPAEDQRVLSEERELLSRRRDYLLVRVDRLDLSKNIIRGFLAFDRFLDLHPEFRERITFLALLQPSREDVEEYVEYRRRVLRTVEQVNTKQGTTDWMPIDLRIQDNFPATLAAYRNYDALMVNAIFDGMNLVAKEGAIVNRRDGVLILSENTGAFEELSAFCVPVNPFDIEEQAQAIHRALTMPASDRKALAEQIRAVVACNSIEKWIAAQFADIEAKLESDGRAPEAQA
jgi:trehalose 6-phosphate synthase